MVKHLTQPETDHLLDTPDNRRDRAIIKLLLNTGLRVGELCQLRSGDIKGDTIWVRAETTKTKTAREIPLNKEALAAVWTLRGRTMGDGLIHISTRRVQQIVKFWGECAGIAFPLTPHKLRHTFATRLIERGVATRIIQVLLGHTALSSTQIYTAVSRDVLANAVKRLEPLEPN